MKRWSHHFSILISVLVLVALAPATRVEEPETTKMSNIPFVALPPISQPQEFGGVFTYSNGFGGTNLELKDGKYVERFFSCTHDGVSSQGHYRFEDQMVLLRDEASDEVRTLYKTHNGLMELCTMNNFTFIRKSVQTGYSDGSKANHWRDSSIINLNLEALRIRKALGFR